MPIVPLIEDARYQKAQAWLRRMGLGVQDLDDSGWFNLLDSYSEGQRINGYDFFADYSPSSGGFQGFLYGVYQRGGYVTDEEGQDLLDADDEEESDPEAPAEPVRYYPPLPPSPVSDEDPN